MKKVVIVNAMFDIETLFARLLVACQQRGVEVTHMFQYELSRLTPSLIDEFELRQINDCRVSWSPCQ